MKTFKIPVEYTNYGTVEIQAENLEEAIKYALKNVDELPLPDDSEYMEGTYSINKDIGLIEYLNKEEVSDSTRTLLEVDCPITFNEDGSCTMEVNYIKVNKK